MTPITSRCSFLVISILLLSLHSTSADERFVTDICSQTNIPKLCNSVLLSDPRSTTNATTISDLSLIAFDISINTATAANRQADNLARQYRGTPQQNPLAQCTVIYLDMMNELHTGRSLAESSSFAKANNAAVDACMKPDACETQFVSRNLASLLVQTDDDLTNKCVVCATMTQLMIG